MGEYRPWSFLQIPLRPGSRLREDAQEVTPGLVNVDDAQEDLSAIHAKQKRRPRPRERGGQPPINGRHGRTGGQSVEDFDLDGLDDADERSHSVR
jgi:hypothetical protein